MTNKEYLTATLSKFNVSDSDVDLILINQELNGEEDVVVKDAKMAVFKEFSLVLPLANISEGSFSITWNFEALRLWYSQLANDLGEIDLLNVNSNDIDDRSYLW